MYQFRVMPWHGNVIVVSTDYQRVTCSRAPSTLHSCAPARISGAKWKFHARILLLDAAGWPYACRTESDLQHQQREVHALAAHGAAQTWFVDRVAFRWVFSSSQVLARAHASHVLAGVARPALAAGAEAAAGAVSL